MWSLGITNWSVKQTDKGHRNYSIEHLIATDNIAHGPQSIGLSGLLVYPGTPWAFGTDNDLWAFCKPDIEITPIVTNEPNNHWKVVQHFTTEGVERDQSDSGPANPLLEPPDISGSFVKYTKEALEDRDGKPILSSSLERFKGKIVERDASRHSVTIKQNIFPIPLDTWRTYIDAVNDRTLWGLPKNTIKLSNISWARKYYSTNWSSIYYAVTFEFDIDYENFTRKILDEGTKVLRIGGDPEKADDFIPYGGPVILNGAGQAIVSEADQYYHDKELYPEKNLLSLGIPNSL